MFSIERETFLLIIHQTNYFKKITLSKAGKLQLETLICKQYFVFFESFALLYPYFNRSNKVIKVHRKKLKMIFNPYKALFQMKKNHVIRWGAYFAKLNYIHKSRYEILILKNLRKMLLVRQQQESFIYDSIFLQQEHISRNCYLLLKLLLACGQIITLLKNMHLITSDNWIF